MRATGFGEAGQAQSQSFSWQPCVLCGAPIRVSWFLLLAFGYQLTAAFRGGDTFDQDLFLIICGQEAILILTVLCHEFGHGLMARRIGGEIDHILLWPFGGICFSTRPRGVTDPKKILQNDLQVVAAGPSTHFLMTPLWALLLFLLTEALTMQCRGACAECEDGFSCVLHWANPLRSQPFVFIGAEGPLMGHAASLIWELLGNGVRLNVMLFLFNVFFPMYPADGSKLLVVSLMYCGGVPPDKAALVLIISSTACAVLFIGYALRQVLAVNAAFGRSAAMTSGVAGLMGVMSLVEAYRIYELREKKQLHTHPLFQTARSWATRRRESDGTVVARVNQSDMDDDPELLTAEPAECSLFKCCCCPQFWQSNRHQLLSQEDRDAAPQGGVDGEQNPPTAAETREQRERFLRSIEQR
mmetsp:Transcript_683/g.1384  ORF Transcript_683/g.1384 Transcript_683/m.1384 type:complete len:413 (+) Transcript_683:116-1354(+)